MPRFAITVDPCWPRERTHAAHCHIVCVADSTGAEFAIEHHADEPTAETRATQLRARAREIESYPV